MIVVVVVDVVVVDTHFPVVVVVIVVDTHFPVVVVVVDTHFPAFSFGFSRTTGVHYFQSVAVLAEEEVRCGSEAELNARQLPIMAWTCLGQSCLIKLRSNLVP